MKGAQDVLEALKIRSGELENEEAALLDIERARVALLCYCNIPLSADMPEGLFEAWCMAAEQQISGGAAGGVSSISEGDVSVTFSGDGDAQDGGFGWKMIAGRFKRMTI